MCNASKILGILITGMLVPYDDDELLNNNGTATASPYVIAMQNAGIKSQFPLLRPSSRCTKAILSVLPSIVNAGIFTSAFSAGNSFLFCSSRILYGLAVRRQAPKIFAYCTKNGLPIASVLFCVSRLSSFAEFNCLQREHSHALRSWLS